MTWRPIVTPLRKALIATALAVVLSGAGTGVFFLVQPQPPAPVTCAPGVAERGASRECTGVTPGTFTFTPALAAIEDKIAAENRFASKRTHESIGLLMPLTTTSDPTVAAELLHALEGAYAAQHRANHLSLDEKPYIELLLANDGAGDAEWLPVVTQLADLTGPPYYLRAVTGISTSSPATKAAVGWLAQHGIPVAGDAITADDIANSRGSMPFPTLARIAPTNHAEAVALSHFTAIDPQTTVLIEDHHADDYIASLAAAFAATLRGSPYQPIEYTSPPSYADAGDTAGQFQQMLGTLCSSDIHLILFAGRHVQLRQFINELLANGCPQHKFTILTGDDASHLASDPQLDPKALTSASGIILDYAALAFPGSASAFPGIAPRSPDSWLTGYQDFITAMSDAGLGTGKAGLIDGQAIMGHDAVWTVVSGIRNAAVSAPGWMPTSTQIVSAWRLLFGANTVIGASGWICLDDQGNPYDKAVPVVTVSSASGPSLVKVVWPAGGPPRFPCYPPP